MQNSILMKQVLNVTRSQVIQVFRQIRVITLLAITMSEKFRLENELGLSRNFAGWPSIQISLRRLDQITKAAYRRVRHYSNKCNTREPAQFKQAQKSSYQNSCLRNDPISISEDPSMPTLQCIAIFTEQISFHLSSIFSILNVDFNEPLVFVSFLLSSLNLILVFF